MKSNIFVLSVFAALVFSIYSNTLNGPFVFDDTQNIVDNPAIRMTRLTPGGIMRAGFESPHPNRPAAYISFALNYYLDRLHPTGYRLVNILIHLFTGCLLYILIKTTLIASPTTSGHTEKGIDAPSSIAFFAALIWLAHPVQTQSVSYIVQRMNSMSAMFYLLAMLMYAKGRRTQLQEDPAPGRAAWGPRAYFIGALCSWMLALGSKEIAASLPFFILLYEWYFFQNLDPRWLKRNLPLFVGLPALLALVMFMYMGVHPFDKIVSGYAFREFTLSQRVLTEFRVLFFYTSLLIFPHPSRLNLDHDFPLSHSPLDPATTFAAMAAAIGLIVLAACMAKKERLLSFCIFWFLGNLVIESSVIGLEIIFEHRLYLPSMFAILAAVWLARRIITRGRWFVAILCAAAALCSYWTYERNGAWRDDVVLWEDCVKKSPNKARPYNNLGVALGKRGRLEEAAARYNEAIGIHPEFASAHNNLGNVLADMGRMDEALGSFSRALAVHPDYESAHNNLGAALARLGRWEEAMGHFREALRIRPRFAGAHYNMAVVLEGRGEAGEAERHFLKALRIDPLYAEAHNDLGVALMKQGRADEAFERFSRALQIDPGYAEAHNNMGGALASRGRLEEAVHHFSEAVRIRPDFKEARRNLEKGVRLMKKGKSK